MRTPRLAMARTNASVFRASSRPRDAFAAGDDQGADRAGGPQAARQHLDARRTTHRPRRHRHHPDRRARAGAKRVAISNTEIGPAASSNWKSGKTSTPIMTQSFSTCPEMREICHFGQIGDHARIADGQANCKTRFGRLAMSAPLQIGLVRVPKGDAARLHRTAAGVFQRARRQGASDLETDRAGHQRFRADADADHHVLPIVRSST